MTKLENASGKKPHWAVIQDQYHSGSPSLREIAAMQNITEGAIRKRAKRDGWVRGEKQTASGKVLLTSASGTPLAGFVYVIYIDAPERFYKIGMASRFHARFDQHQCASPYEIGVACAYFVADMRAEERALHEQFKDKRVRGEWFRLTKEDVRRIADRGVLI